MKKLKRKERMQDSHYAFFANKNDDPHQLFEVAEWWIMKHKLDHFEKAVKIKKLIQNEL